jgi:hypothetical protein
MLLAIVGVLATSALLAPADTRVEVPGRVTWLLGEWTRRTELWPDMSLVFREKDRDLLVLDAGADHPRRVYTYPDRAWSRISGPTWSSDGATLYTWLDIHEQLVAMDRTSGQRRSLTRIPTHAWNSKGDEHLDGRPVWRRNGVVEDVASGLLLFVVNEERNDKVAFWQRRDDRGGSSLVSLDPADGDLVSLAAKGSLPDVILSWDLSVPRRRLYVVSKPHGKYRPGEPHVLEERGFTGLVTRAFVEPAGTAGQVFLSPDDNWLLVEREYKAGKELPTAELDDYTRHDFDLLQAANEGGFILIDLDSGEAIDGPASGTEAAWAPDGQHIAYVDGWDVAVYDREAQSSVQLIRGGPEDRDWGYETWYEPTWSASGRHLALTTGGSGYTLLLDLEAHEFMVLPLQATGKLWALVPTLFGG